MRWTVLGLLVATLAACDGPTPTFQADIQPIFQRSCVTSGCHGGPEEQTGLDLSPGVALDHLVDVPSVQAPLDRVAPGHPDASYLVAKITRAQEAAGGSGEAMPPPFGLAESEVELIRAWILAGAL